MATYAELLLAAADNGLNQKIRVAVIVAAEKVRTESTATTNHAARILWSKSVFVNPRAVAESMVWAVLAQNRAATYEQIVGANDATVQAAVDAAVDVFAQ